MSHDTPGAQRLYLIGTVKATAPLHIGSGETAPRPGRPDTDRPVQLDPDGQPYLPATALGGLLRNTAENLVTALDDWKIQDVLNLFGSARERDDERKKKQEKGESVAHPSRLRLRHAKLLCGWEGLTEVRDGVGIDRQRAAAKTGLLYNYEVVPAGTTFDLCLELRDGDEKDKQLLALTLEALTTLPTALGGKGGSGFGALQFCLKKVVEVGLTDPDALLRFLSQKQEFKPEEYAKQHGEPWDDWRKNVLVCSQARNEVECRPEPVGSETLHSEERRPERHSAAASWLTTNPRLKTDPKPPAWRVPQAVTFTYRLKVEDPVLVRGREAPEGTLLDFPERRRQDGVKLDLGEETKGIDAAWIGRGTDQGTDPQGRATWEPFLPGPSLRGVFRSHSERILRTLSWHYAEGDEETYQRKVAASDPLEHKDEEKRPGSAHLRSSGFEMQDRIKPLAEEISHERDESQRHRRSQQLARQVWDDSDPGERMFGSSQWKSRVLVSEATVVGNDWKEALFDHVAINRFTGGAAEAKLFNALAITQATFEGKITVFGDELWMLGLVALLFKDLHDGLVRVGSGKTRGYGKVQGTLTKVEVRALPGSCVAETCGLSKPDQGVWAKHEWKKDPNKDGFLAGLDGPLRTLLEEGVCELQEQVKKYTRWECRKEEKRAVHE